MLRGNESRPPILLGNASWTGTLAAVRLLGRHGVPVVLMDDRSLPAARFSHHATRYVRCPPEDCGFVDWLLEYGKRHPGTVLYPTSDSLTYLYALHADDLRRHFRLALSPLDSIVSLLDKKRLYEAAQAVGLSTPRTWFPRSVEDVERLAAEQRDPVLVKPRTQVLSRNLLKGVIVRSLDRLRASYERFSRNNVFGSALVDRYPDSARPMIQSYHECGADQIHMATGFIDRTGRLLATRASVKVLQWPRRLGIGLCMEDAPVEPEIVRGLVELCRRVGYTGLFQAELIRTEQGYLLIDFNPRFYNPLAFEIARGMHLPLMVYAAACEDDTWLEHLAESAARAEPDCNAFCNTFDFRVMLLAQRLSGRMSAEQVLGWQRWYDSHEGRLVDGFADEYDPLPYVAYATDRLYRYVRHPRAFVRNIVFNE